MSCLPEKCCSTPFFAIGYKRLPEGGCEAFGWGRLCDEGRIAEGKRIGEGELLKGNC
jgi:hypothetical protein